MCYIGQMSLVLHTDLWSSLRVNFFFPKIFSHLLIKIFLFNKITFIFNCFFLFWNRSDQKVYLNHCMMMKDNCNGTIKNMPLQFCVGENVHKVKWKRFGDKKKIWKKFFSSKTKIKKWLSILWLIFFSSNCHFIN